MDGFISDGRIGNSHLDVPGHDGSLGFGGKCFPKDLNAFINLFESIGINPTVMKAAWDKNLEVRQNHDWEEIEGCKQWLGVVTGHKGYIGSRLFERLQELGHDVLGIDLQGILQRI